jgi:hypothetical protein
MIVRWWWIVGLAVLMILSGCAPDPRVQAAANATTLQSQQDAADQAQARAQAETKFKLEQTQRAEVSRFWVAWLGQFIQWAGLSLTLAACIVLIRVGQGVGIAAHGIGEAVANMAMVRSNLIAMDPRTRTYPMLVNLRYEGHGIFSAFNPMVGQVVLMDTANPADRQMIATLGMQNLAGIVAYEARHHRDDPAGVGMIGIQPAIAATRESRQDGDDRLEIGAALEMVRDLMPVNGGHNAEE